MASVIFMATYANSHWVIPALQFGLPTLAALVGSWLGFRTRSKDRVSSDAQSLIDDMKDELARLHLDINEMRSEVEQCHNDRLARAEEISELRIKISELKAEIRVLESQMDKNTSKIVDAAEKLSAAADTISD